MKASKSISLISDAVLIACGLILTSTAIASGMTETRDDVAIVYINPEVETYEPITRRNVFLYSRCVVHQVPKEIYGEIERMISVAPYGPFDRLRVRVVVDGPDQKRVFIDANGGINIPHLGVSKRLRATQFNTFKKLLEPLRRAEKADRCNGRWSANAIENKNSD